MLTKLFLCFIIILTKKIGELQLQVFGFLSNNRGTLFSSKIITYFLHKKEGYFSVFYVMKKILKSEELQCQNSKPQQKHICIILCMLFVVSAFPV